MDKHFVLRAHSSAQAPLHFSLAADGMFTPAGPGTENLPDGQPLKILRREPSGLLTVLWGDRVVSGVLSRDNGELRIFADGRLCRLRLREAAVDAMEQGLRGAAQSGGRIEVASPIPGLIKAVLVQAGENVCAGQKLIVLEAMKMENEIVSPHAGKIVALNAAAGSAVAAGAALAAIEIDTGQAGESNGANADATATG